MFLWYSCFIHQNLPSYEQYIFFKSQNKSYWPIIYNIGFTLKMYLTFGKRVVRIRVQSYSSSSSRSWAVTDGRYNSWSRGGYYEVQLRLQGRTSQPTDVCSVQSLYICLCVQPNLISARINPIVVSLSSNIHLQGFPKIRASFWTYIELTAVFNVIDQISFF